MLDPRRQMPLTSLCSATSSATVHQHHEPVGCSRQLSFLLQLALQLLQRLLQCLDVLVGLLLPAAGHGRDVGLVTQNRATRPALRRRAPLTSGVRRVVRVPVRRNVAPHAAAAAWRRAGSAANEQ